jgi:DNA-binding GntR family transcriptional regulator
MMSTRQTTISTKDTVRRIADAVGELIVQGTLRPGERLVEAQLAKRFRTSRSPIREALRLLESEALVVKRARQGFSVTELAVQEVRDIYEVFFVLEELCTRLAAANMTPATSSVLRRLIEEMARAISSDGQARYFDLNMQFHLTILKASGNALLLRLYQLLGRQTIRYRRIPLAMPGRLAQSFEEHRQILEALEARDQERAGQWARQHAENAYKILENHFSLVFWPHASRR